MQRPSHDHENSPEHGSVFLSKENWWVLAVVFLLGWWAFRKKREMNSLLLLLVFNPDTILSRWNPWTSFTQFPLFGILLGLEEAPTSLCCRALHLLYFCPVVGTVFTPVMPPTLQFDKQAPPKQPHISLYTQVMCRKAPADLIWPSPWHSRIPEVHIQIYKAFLQ